MKNTTETQEAQEATAIITKLERFEDGSFFINGAVKVKFEEVENPEDVIANIDYNESLLTEQEANALVDALITKALEAFPTSEEEKATDK